MTDRELLESILDKVGSMEGKINSMDERMTSLDQNVNSMDERISCMGEKINIMDQRINCIDEKIGSIKGELVSLNRKVDTVYEQTAGLLEFRTATNDRLSDIDNSIAYLMHKDSQRDKELFNIKKILSK